MGREWAKKRVLALLSVLQETKKIHNAKSGKIPKKEFLVLLFIINPFCINLKYNSNSSKLDGKEYSVAKPLNLNPRKRTKPSIDIINTPGHKTRGIAQEVMYHTIQFRGIAETAHRRIRNYLVSTIGKRTVFVGQ